MNWVDGENVSIVLFFIGAYGLIARKNIVKTVISIGIMQAAAILLFLAANYSKESVPPIGTDIQGNIADPIPQALMITAIVIGVATTAVSLTMFITLYHKYGTTNWDKVIRKRTEQK